MLEKVNHLVWGLPTLILILGTGAYLSGITGLAQLRYLPKALTGLFLPDKSKRTLNSGVSPFQALCTALASTIGTGNLAGVAGAIALGGPGAVFWIWVCGFLGMVTKFAEASLAVRYRQKDGTGEYVGGPMYMICNGLSKPWHRLAYIYCFLGVVAAFGVGNTTQVNAILGSIGGTVLSFGGKLERSSCIVIGCFLGLLIIIMLLGGLKRISAIAQKMVPSVICIYLILSVGVLIMHYQRIPQALCAIFAGAFSPKAVTGGAIGTFFVTIRTGASRGVFTNEAGMGTASIAHAAAQVRHPIEQGMMGIAEVFLDTIVVCTMTALVILCSGCVVPYGNDVGIGLTMNAFSSVYGNWVQILITAALCCFSVGTILGWGLYGARCAQFLFGGSAWRPFVFAQAGCAVLGAVLSTPTVWKLAEIMNGLMAIPNLIVLLLLSPELRRLLLQYQQNR